MPKENKKILEYNSGEKSLKASFTIYADVNVFFQKYTHVKMIYKNLKQKKKLSIYFQVAHVLHAVHLIHQKMNGIIIEKKTVWKNFVKI